LENLREALVISKFRFLRVPPGKVFEVLPGNDFHGINSLWLILFRRHDLVEQSFVKFILGWNFLNKTLNPNFTLGPYIGIRTKRFVLRGLEFSSFSQILMRGILRTPNFNILSFDTLVSAIHFTKMPRKLWIPLFLVKICMSTSSWPKRPWKSKIFSYLALMGVLKIATARVGRKSSNHVFIKSHET
jgi:hypothetical protein